MINSIKNRIILISTTCLIIWLVEFFGFHASGAVHIFLLVSVMGLLLGFGLTLVEFLEEKRAFLKIRK